LISFVTYLPDLMSCSFSFILILNDNFKFDFFKFSVMNSKVSILVVTIIFLITNCFAQEKSKKELKEERKIEYQNQIEALIGTKEFVFKANTASPIGFKTVGLTPNLYYVRFQPDLVVSFMPYYGKAYGNMGFSNDTGLNFEGIPEEFTSSTGKKSYQVKVKVSSEGNAYTLIITIRFDGVTSLSISSNNRSNIVFDGYITPPEMPEEKR